MARTYTKFILSCKGKVIDEYSLDDKRITVGRHLENTIRVDDAAVSARHALILALDEGGSEVVIQDLASTNGLFVNGEQVTSRVLQNGDIIEVGEHRLTCVQQGGGPAAGLDKTVLIRGARRRSRQAQPARLLILDGPEGGQHIELNRLNTAIGEAGGRRAVITKRAGSYILAHLWGEGFPLVNGEPIPATGRVLEDSDIIEVAGAKMEFLTG